MSDLAGPDDTRSYTPALGKAWLTPFYDSAIGLLTRERTWRSALVHEASLTPEDSLIDIGSGTGSLLRDLKISCPQARLIGVEPDPGVLAIAKRKLGRAAELIRWHNGFLDSLSLNDGQAPNKIVSSLVFHQVPMEQKRAILQQMHSLLQPGGMVLIADYMRQESSVMRALFRATVQQLDGIKDTQPNADGIMEQMLVEIFHDAEKLHTFRTATGAISLWRGYKEES